MLLTGGCNFNSPFHLIILRLLRKMEREGDAAGARAGLLVNCRFRLETRLSDARARIIVDSGG